MVGGCGQALLADTPIPPNSSLLAAHDDTEREATYLLPRNPVRGQQEAFNQGSFLSCFVCHGAEGKGNQAVDGPALHHLPAWYIEAQLRAFRSGWRGRHPNDQSGHLMYAVAQLMDDKAIIAASKYISSIRPSMAAPSVPSAVRPPLSGAEAGERLYGQRCAACHGERGLGQKELHAPPLATMAYWSFRKQMENYINGVRGYAQKDVHGQQMKAICQGIELSAVDDIWAFFAAERSVNPKP